MLQSPTFIGSLWDILSSKSSQVWGVVHAYINPFFSELHKERNYKIGT